MSYTMDELIELGSLTPQSQDVAVAVFENQVEMPLIWVAEAGVDARPLIEAFVSTGGPVGEFAPPLEDDAPLSDEAFEEVAAPEVESPAEEAEALDLGLEDELTAAADAVEVGEDEVELEEDDLDEFADYVYQPIILELTEEESALDREAALLAAWERLGWGDMSGVDASIIWVAAGETMPRVKDVLLWEDHA